MYRDYPGPHNHNIVSRPLRQPNNKISQLLTQLSWIFYICLTLLHLQLLTLTSSATIKTIFDLEDWKLSHRVIYIYVIMSCRFVGGRRVWILGRGCDVWCVVCDLIIIPDISLHSSLQCYQYISISSSHFVFRANMLPVYQHIVKEGEEVIR